MRNTTYSEKNRETTGTKKPGMRKKIGDAIESVGKSAQRAGAKKLGKAIERVGDKIEHSGERKARK
jgi:hypothetical protein